MKRQFERLEQALRLWEDNCYTYDVNRRACKLWRRDPPFTVIEPMLHWQEFRDYLLHFRKGKQFDDRRFFGSGPASLPELATIRYTPEALAGWTIGSRRVYHLESDLQILLSLTSMKGISWADVPWPFNSFAITLDQPIITQKLQNGTQCTVEYDTIILYQTVVPLPDNVLRREARIVLLDKALERRRGLSRFDREEIDSLVARGKLNRALDLLESKTKGTPVAAEWFGVDLAAAGESLVGRTSEFIRDKGTILGEDSPSFESWDAAARIVGGLCLYLTTLPPKSSHVSQWQPVEPGIKNPDPRAISTGAEVCLVSAQHKLTPEEIRVIREIGSRGFYELCAHWRTGHWRRKPGFGNDPTARKTVQVLPTLVRQDRLAEGEQPGGSEFVI